MLKILYSEVDSIHGGIESFLINITGNFDHDKIKSIFFMSGENKSIENKLIGSIYKIPNSLLAYILFVKENLQKEHYNIAHINKNSLANIILPIMIRLFSPKTKIIIHSHNTKPSQSFFALKYFHEINRFFIPYISDAKFACSDLAAIWMFGKKAYTNGEVKIIKNGIVVHQYKYNYKLREKQRNLLGIKKNTILIGNVGRLSKQKNQLFLIDILEEMIRNGHDTKLVICGEGEERNNILQKAKRKNLLNNVQLLGACPNVNEILQAVDVFIMPSLYEGLTIAAIEAQCAGLPCIFSDTISDETIVTANCVKLSLKADISVWENMVLKSLDMKREDTTKQIVDAGFDNMQSAIILKNYYLDMMKTGR